MERNIGLVRKQAHARSKRKKDLFDDLFQEGCLGFLKALDRWSPTFNTKLSTYATWWVAAFQVRFINKTRRLVTYGNTGDQRKFIRKLPVLRAKLDASGLGATTENLASLLDMPPERVQKYLDDLALSDSVSIDDHDNLSTPNNAENAVVDADMLRIVLVEAYAYRQYLDPRSTAIFDGRVLSSEKTLDALGEEFGICRERVRQLEERMLPALRKRVLKRVLDPQQPKPASC